MNAPTKQQPCESDMSYCRFGFEALIKLLEVFEEQLNGVIKNDDVEYVHKTRVGSRRLRATLPLFRSCIQKKQYKKWNREIKNVTRLLAEARDLDVQIIFVEHYIEGVTEAEKKCLNILIEEYKDRRKSIQSTVLKGIEKLKASNILDDLQNFSERFIIEQSYENFNPQNVLEKAQWHISSRLDDLLAMEKYVHQENEIVKLHEMRIYAKKLRYTMETFASLYNNKLEGEISTIKAFQDALGEMHDCDVWIENIPKFAKEASTRAKFQSKKKLASLETALENFSTYVREKRKENYFQFVHSWDKNKKDNFFIQLRKKITVEYSSLIENTKLALAKPDIKVAVLSDIHANLLALKKVIEDAQAKGIDVFINAGDSIGFGPCPNEVVELLSEKNVLSILGNFDLEVIERKNKTKAEKNLALRFARKELSKSCKCHLSSLPRELRLEVAGKKMLVTHGSPESIEEHIYHNTPVKRLNGLAINAKVDLIVVGHSHEQFWRKVNGVSFVNPGSVGRPGDRNPQASYAMLSFNPFAVELIRLDYDVWVTADAIRKKGLPESFAQMFLRGVSLNEINELDKTNEYLIVESWKETSQKLKEISKKFWPDPEHYDQVSKLATGLFDGLLNLHQMGIEERRLLESAAILHDIGLSKSRKSHHKESAKIILNHPEFPFSSQQRRIIAGIARYHRKGLPKQSHYILKGLDKITQQNVKALASILRVADGLDYAHQSIVESLNIKADAQRITVECVSKTEHLAEEQAFNKKKDMFEKVFAKKMVLIWK